MSLCNNTMILSEDGFARVTNNGEGFFIFFEVAMFINSQDITISSTTMSQGQTNQIPISGNAYNININIYISSDGENWALLVIQHFDIPSVYCFNIDGTLANPNVTRVPCNEFQSCNSINDPSYCINKTTCSKNNKFLNYSNIY